jgi:CubicO group peptidase (beta-lactamase class C family)
LVAFDLLQLYAAVSIAIFNLWSDAMTFLRSQFLSCLVRSVGFLFAALIAISVSAQSSADKDRIAQIDAILTERYKPTEPGAVVIIAKNGVPLLRKAYGLADVENKVALTPADVLRIGSVTKSFTAMAILLLEDEGKLSVDDDIKRFLPDYPAAAKKITIAHLLAHTSGVAIYTDLPRGRNAAALKTTDEVINLIKNAPAINAPGEQYFYNNSGYYLLGAIIEKASGLSYAEFLAKRIFTPLAMHNTAVEGHERGAKRVRGYRSEASQFSLAPDINPVMTYAAGAIVSSADDLLRWHIAIQQQKLLKPATWKRTFTPQLLNSGKPVEYGYGWVLRQLRGQAMQEHSGVVAGFQAMQIMLPQDNLSVIFLTNQQTRQNTARRLGEQIAAITIGKPFVDRKTIDMADDVLAQFEGIYQMDGKPTRTITRVGKQLRQQSGNSQSMMLPYADNAFFNADGSHTHFRFEKNRDGKVSAMIRIDSGDTEETYKRIGDLV